MPTAAVQVVAGFSVGAVCAHVASTTTGANGVLSSVSVGMMCYVALFEAAPNHQHGIKQNAMQFMFGAAGFIWTFAVTTLTGAAEGGQENDGSIG